MTQSTEATSIRRIQESEWQLLRALLLQCLYTIRSERFSADFGVDEWFGFNVFLRDGNNVYRTYFLQHGAMVQWIGSLWSLWSLTPYGGQSDDEDLPEGWPRAPGSFWFRRHDEFDEPAPSAGDVAADNA